MENKNKSSLSFSFGIPDILFVVFLVLKLCHVIDWSWWWVTAPLWIQLALVVVILVICIIAAAIKNK